MKCLRPNSTVSFSAFRTFNRFLLIFSILASSWYFYCRPVMRVSPINPLVGYDSMTTLPDQSYFGGVQEQRPSTISPQLLPSNHPYGMSTPRTSSKAVSRSPPRERTPIRHHRPSVSRARSGSRPEVLLAYAEHQHQKQQQQQQAVSAMH